MNLIAPFWINTPLLQPRLAQLVASGATRDKAFAFAKIDDVANVATKFAADESISGRAFSVLPNDYFDMHENTAGGWTGDFLRQQWKVPMAEASAML